MKQFIYSVCLTLIKLSYLFHKKYINIMLLLNRKLIRSIKWFTTPFCILKPYLYKKNIKLPNGNTLKSEQKRNATQKTSIMDLNRRVLQYVCSILQTYNAFCKFINDVFCRLCLLKLEMHVQNTIQKMIWFCNKTFYRMYKKFM